MKKKILIVINGEVYLRNYIKTKVFKKLIKNYDVSYIANKEIINKSLLKSLKNFSGFFNVHKEQSTKENRIRNVLMWRYRYLSKSFIYRIKWFSEINIFELYEDFTFKLLLNKIFRIGTVLKFNIYVRVFGNFLLFPFFKYFYFDNDNVIFSLEKKIIKENPDLIIFPTDSQTKVGNDILKICIKKKIKTLYLIDNWDNLSDKTVMLDKPDYLAVWGQQSKNHAINIQKINSKTVSNIGTPRYDLYFDKRKKKLKNHFKFRYILFLGTALEFDEFKIISKIDTILEKKPFFGKIKLIYRPHPWRMSKKIINFKKYKNTLLDPQISKNFYKKKMDLGFQPNLNYYPNLIKNSEFVIGGLTSMMIESLIMYKKYLITALPERKFNNQFNSLNYHTHFKELKTVKNIKICTSLNDLENKILHMWKNKIDKYKSETDKDRNYFVFNDSLNYDERLKNIVKDII